MPFPSRPSLRFPVRCSVTYNAGPFQAKVPSGISRILSGDSPEICRCDRGKPSCSRSRFRMSHALRSLKRWPDGREDRSARSTLRAAALAIFNLEGNLIGTGFPHISSASRVFLALRPVNFQSTIRQVLLEPALQGE